MGNVTTRCVLLCGLAATSCQTQGGSGDSGSSNAGMHAVPLASASGSAGVAGTSTSDVGFEATVMPLVDEACRCHQTEPILMAPFSLKHGEAYANLVRVPATQLPSMSLIEPGSLNASYLWHKINGTQLQVGGSGLIMPSTIPLTQAERDVFGRWIAAGAPR